MHRPTWECNRLTLSVASSSSCSASLRARSFCSSSALSSSTSAASRVFRRSIIAACSFSSSFWWAVSSSSNWMSWGHRLMIKEHADNGVCLMCESDRKVNQWAARWTDLDLNLQVSQEFLGLWGLPVGVAQLHLHLIQVTLHLLLQAQCLVARLGLSIQGGLHGVQRSLVATARRRTT